MPALSVSIDGILVAVVSTEGNDVVSVRVSGTRLEEDLAHLELSGGPPPREGRSTHLTWVNSLPINAGQTITVSFLASGESSVPGLTIEEMFPGEEMPGTEDIDFKPNTDIFADLRSRHQFRDKWVLKLRSSNGLKFNGETNVDDHGFGFTVLWNSFYPERARLSLHSYTLEDLEKKGPMKYFAEEKLLLGGTVDLEVLA